MKKGRAVKTAEDGYKNDKTCTGVNLELQGVQSINCLFLTASLNEL